MMTQSKHLAVDLFWVILTLLFVLVVCLESKAGDIPDTPQPQTDCTYHGKPCGRLVHKLIGPYPPPIYPIDPVYVNQREVRIWTFRKHWYSPPLRTDKQILKSPWFIISQAAFIVPGVIACQRSKTTGEEYHSERFAMAGVFGLDFLLTKYVDEVFAFGSASYASQHYIRSNLK